MGLRVIGGKMKGRKLHSVRGAKTRPTADRVREAIFDILAFDVRRSTVLDLFAGTGAFGIEALSRGAESAVFVDRDRDSISVLRKNIEHIGLENRTKIIQWDLAENLNCLRLFDPAFDLVFMDPPYNQNMIAPTLFKLHCCRCLQKGARIVVEHSHGEPIVEKPLPFEIADQRRYGKTVVSFLNYMI